jgi:hypothetical protein
MVGPFDIDLMLTLAGPGAKLGRRRAGPGIGRIRCEDSYQASTLADDADAARGAH